MEIDTTSLGSVYDVLEGKASGTLSKFVNNYSLTETQKSQILSNAIVALIQTSAQIMLDLPAKEAQIGAINSEKSIKEAQSTKDLLVKDKQITVMEEQRISEVKKQELSVRQAAYYGDQLRVHESDHLSRITMGALQSGSAVREDLYTATLNAAAAITP